ncbi:hypothetical protein [Romboutsia ilealis]|uniref:hypothetical protein n=1 Tax=Romboutsia ilealis TaxID=1115758 RepID=UPI0026F38E40|nr:hypothetical protein [Romboutsia ilealis]
MNIELKNRVDKWLDQLPYTCAMYLKDCGNGQYSMNYITTHEVVNYFKSESELKLFLDEDDENKRMSLELEIELDKELGL